MWAGILAVFQGIKAFGDTFKEVVSLLKQAYDMYKQAKLEGWLQEGKIIATEIKNLQSDTERRELVKKLADHLSDNP